MGVACRLKCPQWAPDTSPLMHPPSVHTVEQLEQPACVPASGTLAVAVTVPVAQCKQHFRQGPLHGSLRPLHGSLRPAGIDGDQSKIGVRLAFRFAAYLGSTFRNQGASGFKLQLRNGRSCPASHGAAWLVHNLSAQSAGKLERGGLRPGLTSSRHLLGMQSALECRERARPRLLPGRFEELP